MDKNHVQPNLPESRNPEGATEMKPLSKALVPLVTIAIFIYSIVQIINDPTQNYGAVSNALAAAVSSAPSDADVLAQMKLMGVKQFAVKKHTLLSWNDCPAEIQWDDTLIGRSNAAAYGSGYSVPCDWKDEEKYPFRVTLGPHLEVRTDADQDTVSTTAEARAIYNALSTVARNMAEYKAVTDQERQQREANKQSWAKN